jgi:hypothetical protein
MEWDKLILAIMTPIVTGGIGWVLGSVMESRKAKAALAQERWRMRAGTYRTLLETLAGITQILGRHARAEIAGLSHIVEGRTSSFEPAARVEDWRELDSLIKTLRTTRAVAALWVDDAALQALKRLEDEWSQNARAGDDTGRAAEMAQQAITDILAAARPDLKLKMQD